MTYNPDWKPTPEQKAGYRAQQRHRYAADPEYRAKRQANARAVRLKMRYGITVEEYDRRMAEQGGVCGICGQPERLRQNLAVDHDHDTGAIRGLLCFDCNVGLGKLERYIDRASAYLQGGQS